MRIRVGGLLVIFAGIPICGFCWAQAQGNEDQGQRVMLRQAMAPPCTISGIVRDANGEPLANALVSVKQNEED